MDIIYLEKLANAWTTQYAIQIKIFRCFKYRFNGKSRRLEFCKIYNICIPFTIVPNQNVTCYLPIRIVVHREWYERSIWAYWEHWPWHRTQPKTQWNNEWTCVEVCAHKTPTPQEDYQSTRRWWVTWGLKWKKC